MLNRETPSSTTAGSTRNPSVPSRRVPEITMTTIRTRNKSRMTSDTSWNAPDTECDTRLKKTSSLRAVETISPSSSAAVALGTHEGLLDSNHTHQTITHPAKVNGLRMTSCSI